MGVFEIIAAILLILACIFIVLVVLMQDSKQGMSQTITGASGDNYYQKNSGRTREAKLNKFTKVAAVFFFVIALLVNVVSIYSSNNPSTNGGEDIPAITTSAENTPEVTTQAADGTEGTVEASDTTAPEVS